MARHDFLRKRIKRLGVMNAREIPIILDDCTSGANTDALPLDLTVNMMSQRIYVTVRNEDRNDDLLYVYTELHEI